MAKPAARKTAKDKRASARAAGKTAYKYQVTRMDQCCDGVVVTEVTEDTVTALCDYGS